MRAPVRSIPCRSILALLAAAVPVSTACGGPAPSPVSLEGEQRPAPTIACEKIQKYAERAARETKASSGSFERQVFSSSDYLGCCPPVSGRVWSCEDGHSTILRVAQNFLLAGDPENASTGFLVLVSPDRGMNQSTSAAAAAAALPRLAGEQESRARSAPNTREAVKALEGAIELRVASGDFEAARLLTERFMPDLEKGSPAAAVRLHVFLAHQLTRRGRFEVAEGLESGIATVERDGELDVQLMGYAVLGRSYQAKGRTELASQWYSRVLDRWRAPSTRAEMQINASTDQREHTARSLRAASEALFHVAEAKGRQAEAIAFPEFTGPAAREAVQTFVNTDVKSWTHQKKSALDEATTAYKAIVDLEPVPPPEFVIAAGSRVGSLWADFAEQFLSVPVPDDFSPEVRAKYRNALVDAARPALETARGALTTCVNYSAAYRYTDDFARACEKRLNSHRE